MTRETRFSWDSEQQKAEFEAYARARGLSLPAFAKHACFVVKEKYRLGSHHPAKSAGRTATPRPVAPPVGNGNAIQDAT